MTEELYPDLGYLLKGYFHQTGRPFPIPRAIPRHIDAWPQSSAQSRPTSRWPGLWLISIRSSPKASPSRSYALSPCVWLLSSTHRAPA